MKSKRRRTRTKTRRLQIVYVRMVLACGVKITRTENEGIGR